MTRRATTVASDQATKVASDQELAKARARIAELAAPEECAQLAAGLEVSSDPPPPAAGPLEPERAPEEPPAVAAPDLGQVEVPTGPTASLDLSTEELREICGELWVTLHTLVVARVAPLQPLTSAECGALKKSGGALIAYYLPEELGPETMLWVAAGTALAAVYLPRLKSAPPTAEPPAESAT